MSSHSATYPIFIILMQIDTASLRLPPLLRYTFIYIRLVYDFRDELRAVVYQGGIGSRNLEAVDCVGSAVFDEEGKEGEDLTDQEDDDKKVDDYEDNEATTHCLW